MIYSRNNPELLLFTDYQGNREQLQDIISDGLDGGYEDRIPYLIDLMNYGETYHQLLACVMLTSWGHPLGFQRLMDWASNFEEVPWKENPVVYDRIYGSDSAFEMLADALRTSFYCDENETLKKWQIAGTKALLNIYHCFYFGRTLAYAIVRGKEIAVDVKNEIKAAIETSLSILQKNTLLPFDLLFQVVSLLIVLAPIEDNDTAYYANQIISNYHPTERSWKELADALSYGTGQATLEILQQMKNIEIPTVRHYVENIIAHRLDHLAH